MIWNFAVAAPLSVCLAVDKSPEPIWECRWTPTPITLDGRADEPVWAQAQPIERFTTPWLPEDPVGKTATRARLLWDADALYFHVDMVDGDLFANVTEHDGETWLNDVLELFLKPAVDKRGYFEFQVNAAGTTFDMFVPVKNDADSFLVNSKKDLFAWQTKVVRRGTLNERDDRDEGWSVEGRIPWIDLIQTGARPKPEETWRFAVCRYDYDKRWSEPNLSTNGRFTEVNFHQTEKFAPLKFIGPKPDQVRPHGLNNRVPLTTSKVAGSPDPPPPYHAVRAFPNLKIRFPIMVCRQPGAELLLALVHERSEGGVTSLVRFKDDPEVTDFETLLTLQGTAYDLTFHPRFAENGHIFVGWNGTLGDPTEKRESRVSRFTIDRAAPYRLDVASEVRIIAWPSHGHDGAAVAFGNDGLLYVTSGDGTTDSDEDVVGQDMSRLTAKVLRINADCVTEADRAAGRNYSIPADNPFVALAGARPETWAYGLRNPWRMTVDSRTGHLWVAQNGQDVWEQAYLVGRGENYGWSVTEGGHPFYLERKRGPTPIIPPTVEHPHSEARSLTGGVVYYGQNYSDLRGSYIYGDYATGKIWAVLHDGSRVVKRREIADTSLAITAFGLDAHGEMLIANYRSSEQRGFYRLEPTPLPVGPSAFPRRLSESGLFEPERGHTVVPAVVPYSVNAALWSDGAYKERFLALPAETTVTYHSRRSWGFPEGTVLIKSFALETETGNPKSRRWIETRFLTKQAGEWVGYSYEWNEEQTDATLVESAGRDRLIDVVDAQAPGGRRMQTWRYPSRAECMICHSQAANHVLGLTTAQLNREHDYGSVRDNQLRAWAHADILKGIEGSEWKEAHAQSSLAAGRSAREADADWLALTRAINAMPQRRSVVQSELGVVAEHYARLADPYDRSATLEQRVRSYLHANCAQCHVTSGGGNAKIQMNHWATPLEAKYVDEASLHATFGLREPRIVAPGKPENSVLLYRMAQRGRGQMPPLASSMVDQEAVALIREWITSLPRGCKLTGGESE